MSFAVGVSRRHRREPVHRRLAATTCARSPPPRSATITSRPACQPCTRRPAPPAPLRRDHHHPARWRPGHLLPRSPAAPAPPATPTAGQYCVLPQDRARPSPRTPAPRPTRSPPPPATPPIPTPPPAQLTSETDTAGDTLTVTYNSPLPGTGNCPSIGQLAARPSPPPTAGPWSSAGTPAWPGHLGHRPDGPGLDLRLQQRRGPHLGDRPDDQHHHLHLRRRAHRQPAARQ